MSKDQDSQRPQQSLGKGGQREGSPVLGTFSLFMVLSQQARKKASHSLIAEDVAAVTYELICMTPSPDTLQGLQGCRSWLGCWMLIL